MSEMFDKSSGKPIFLSPLERAGLADMVYDQMYY